MLENVASTDKTNYYLFKAQIPEHQLPSKQSRGKIQQQLNRPWQVNWASGSTTDGRCDGSGRGVPRGAPAAICASPARPDPPPPAPPTAAAGGACSWRRRAPGLGPTAQTSAPRQRGEVGRGGQRGAPGRNPPQLLPLGQALAAFSECWRDRPILNTR